MKFQVNEEFEAFVARRSDPNYAQVSGYINKELAMRFKVACTASEISQTDALEEAVALWLEKHEQKQPHSSGTSRGKGGNKDE